MILGSHNSWTQKLGTMKKSSLRRLSPKEFDANLLRQLTLEGRVYIDVPQVVDKNAYKREILEYVQAIDTHYKVYKTEDNDATRTRIALLDYNQRIREIASMMSGATLTQAALDNAKTLIDNNGR